MTACSDRSEPSLGTIEAITYRPTRIDGPHRGVWLYASACAAEQSMAAFHDMGAHYLELRRHSLPSAQAVIRLVLDEGLELDEMWRELHARGWLLEVHRAIEAAHRADLSRTVLRPDLSRRRPRQIRRR